MTARKVLTAVLEVLAILSFLFGICLMFASKGLVIAAGVVVICLSLAFGIIMGNIISTLGLMLGIAILVFPSWIVGGIFICLGLAGMITGIVLWRKIRKASRTKVIYQCEN